MHRGQVTIFILAGIMLAAAIGILFFYRSNLTELREGSSLQEVATTNPTAFEAGNQIEHCISAHLDSALRMLGLQGGNIIPLESAFIYQGTPIAMYAEPLQKDDIEKDISNFMKEQIISCKAISTSLEITSPGVKEVITSIEPEQLTLEVAWPITFKGGETSTRVKGFTIRKEIRLGMILDDINGIIEESSEGLCLSCLVEVSDFRGYNIEVQSAEKDVITIIDKQS